MSEHAEVAAAINASEKTNMTMANERFISSLLSTRTKWTPLQTLSSDGLLDARHDAAAPQREHTRGLGADFGQWGQPQTRGGIMTDWAPTRHQTWSAARIEDWQKVF
jgi:hypothetical protein